MQPALLTRFRPAGPWRYGPADGALDRVDLIYRSDRLFSALTIAMQQLGSLNKWLDATAHASEPAIALSSLFPFQGETLFAIPPATVWPPPASQVSAPNSAFLAKIRWKAASFVPLPVIDSLLTRGSLLADQWMPDGESGCLLRRDRPSTSPFRVVQRRNAAVDRIAGTTSATVSRACVEFEPGAGLWQLTRYKDGAAEAEWRERVESAFRLLADTGFGGRRTSGWGQASAPEFQRGSWPAILLPKLARVSLNGAAAGEANRENSKFWLLSLYSPASRDRVDWSAGDYAITDRAGRIQSNGHSGEEKRAVRMVAEGSVLAAAAELSGAAVNVAPENFAHPVYRSGLALALELPQILPQSAEEIDMELRPAEEPVTEEPVTEEAVTEEAVVDRPCEEPGLEPVAANQPEHESKPVQPEPEHEREPEAAPQAETEVAEELVMPPEEVQPDPESESEPPVKVESPDDPGAPSDAGAPPEESGHAL